MSKLYGNTNFDRKLAANMSQFSRQYAGSNYEITKGKNKSNFTKYFSFSSSSEDNESDDLGYKYTSKSKSKKIDISDSDSSSSDDFDYSKYANKSSTFLGKITGHASTKYGVKKGKKYSYESSESSSESEEIYKKYAKNYSTKKPIVPIRKSVRSESDSDDSSSDGQAFIDKIRAKAGLTNTSKLSVKRGKSFLSSSDEDSDSGPLSPSANSKLVISKLVGAKHDKLNNTRSTLLDLLSDSDSSDSDDELFNFRLASFKNNQMKTGAKNVAPKKKAYSFLEASDSSDADSSDDDKPAKNMKEIDDFTQKAKPGSKKATKKVETAQKSKILSDNDSSDGTNDSDELIRRVNAQIAKSKSERTSKIASETENKSSLASTPDLDSIKEMPKKRKHSKHHSPPSSPLPDSEPSDFDDSPIKTTSSGSAGSSPVLQKTTSTAKKFIKTSSIEMSNFGEEDASSEDNDKDGNAQDKNITEIKQVIKKESSTHFSDSEEEENDEMFNIPKPNTPEWNEWLKKQVDDFGSSSEDSENEELSPKEVIVPSPVKETDEADPIVPFDGQSPHVSSMSMSD